jgi:Putative MetA-pathway of phenol degradation
MQHCLRRPVFEPDVKWFQNPSIAAFLLLWTLAFRAPALADDCVGDSDWINTDRPDQTNSSAVVPLGSLQIENGINWNVGQGSNVLDGSETSMRLGIFHCTEFEFDPPNYFYSINGTSASGFSDSAIAFKYQLDMIPDPFQLATSAGLGLPSGSKKISGYGWDPYLQLPWQVSLTQQWSVNGMLSLTWYTQQPSQNPTFEPTVVIQRGFAGKRGTATVEYASIFDHRQPIQILDLGGQWRPSFCSQVDFQTGMGLNRRSPDYFFGLGYSFRLDEILQTLRQL